MDQSIAEVFQFCPRCGAPVESPGRNPLTCGPCGYQHHFSPVTAVAGIITGESGEVLLLIRGKDPGRGLFGLPGGFVDPGESAETALAREVFEETSLVVRRMTWLGTFANQYHYRGVVLPVTDLFFACEVESLAGLKCDGREITGVHFCRPGPDELDRMAFESNRRGLELYLQKAGRGGA